MQILGYLSYLLFIVCIVAMVLKYSQLLISNKIIGWIIVLSVVSEIIGYVCAKYYHYNLFLSHIFSPIECILFMVAYGIELRIPKANIIVYVSIVIILSAINSIFIQPITSTFDSFFIAFEALILTLFSFAFFYRLLQETELHPLYTYSFFWISIGWLFYGTGSLLFLGMLNSDIKFQGGKAFGVLKLLKYFFNVLLYLCILLSFIFHRQHLKSKTVD